MVSEKAKTFGIAGLAVVWVCMVMGVLVAVGWFVNSMSVYYTQDYKPQHMVESQDNKKMRARGADYEFEAITLSVEWNTYDNETINQPPYKLAVWVRAKTPAVDSVRITGIHIDSSLEKQYAVTTELPYAVDGEKLYSEYGDFIVFEPAFDFGFEEGEAIVLRMTVEVAGEGGTDEVVLEETFVPITLKRSAPIV